MLSTLINLTHKYMPGRVADTLIYLKDQVVQFQSLPFCLYQARISGYVRDDQGKFYPEFKGTRRKRYYPTHPEYNGNY